MTSLEKLEYIQVILQGQKEQTALLLNLSKGISKKRYKNGIDMIETSLKFVEELREPHLETMKEE